MSKNKKSKNKKSKNKNINRVIGGIKMNKIIRTSIPSDTTPDKSFMANIGKNNMKAYEAISDIVDNSWDARIPGQILTVDIKIDEDFILIEDDGLGMNEKAAQKSRVYSLSTKGKSDVGKYGMGLQNAASTLGKSMNLKTTQSWSNIEYSYESNFSGLEGFDQEMFLDEHQGDEVFVKKTGTQIKMTELHQKQTEYKIRIIRQEIEKIYSVLILNQELKIVINDVVCIADEPVLKTEYEPLPDGNFVPDNTGRHHFEIRLESGAMIHGWRGLLQKAKQSDHGFHLFSNNRLIKQHAKIGFKEHPMHHQIVGEIHLDHVQASILKNSFIESTPEYLEITDDKGVFWMYMRPFVVEAERNSKRFKNQKISDQTKIQDKQILDMLNNLDELDGYQILEQPDFPKGESRGDGSESETKTIEQRDTSKPPISHPTTKGRGTRKGTKRNPTNTQDVIKLIPRDTNSNWSFDSDFIDTLNPESPYESIRTEHGLHININIDFEGWAIGEFNYGNGKNAEEHFVDFCKAESIAKYLYESEKYPSHSEFELRNILWAKIGNLESIKKTKRRRAA